MWRRHRICKENHDQSSHCQDPLANNKTIGTQFLQSYLTKITPILKATHPQLTRRRSNDPVSTKWFIMSPSDTLELVSGGLKPLWWIKVSVMIIIKGRIKNKLYIYIFLFQIKISNLGTEKITITYNN